MRVEPRIDRRRLAEAARDAYGLAVADISFMPLGYAETACYIVETSVARYFLKIWPRMRPDGRAAERRRATLALMRALADLDVGLHVSVPLETKQGALSSGLDGAPFALFAFILGVHPSEPWPAPVAEEVGRAIGALHLATPELTNLPLPVEAFELSIDASLRRLLEIAAQVADGTPARQWAREHRAGVLTQLDRLRRLQPIVRALDGPRVLCHTDLHYNNLIVDGQGRLWLLDWDDAILAPPEHDLWTGLGVDARGSHFEAFLAAYRAMSADIPLHLDHFAFYLLRRYLNDAAEDLNRLLDAGAAGDGNETDLLLHSLDECVDRWSRLDATLATIAAAL
jgi:Ser/Thr protein kinase RdoA (MazF antagonist)